MNWHPFGYTGKPGTCRWCGRKLRYGTVIATDADKDNPTYKDYGANFATKRATRAGGYQDDRFCGLRCGYQYGVRAAS